jgi:hypothetical protein
MSPCFTHGVKVKLELFANAEKVTEAKGEINESTTIDFPEPYFVPGGVEIFTRLEFEQDYTCAVAHDLSAALIVAEV